MFLKGLTVGFALTGSFCTFKAVIPQVKRIVEGGASVIPIMSETAAATDTRFGTADYFKSELEEIAGKPVICSIKDAEPIGPRKLLDALIIAPCTGNTLSKLAAGIADTSVTMAAKAHLRNARPLILAVSSNDALSQGAKNIGQLLNAKNIYMVPYGQDDPVDKQTSMVANMEFIPETLSLAIQGRQIQPLILGSN